MQKAPIIQFKHHLTAVGNCLFFFSQHAPGVPRILVGNRLHLAFKRQVPTEQARAYAEKNGMTFFEVSPLCNFNVIESFTELSRIVLMRHGMEKFWRPNRGGWMWSWGRQSEERWVVKLHSAGFSRPPRAREMSLRSTVEPISRRTSYRHTSSLKLINLSSFLSSLCLLRV